MGHRGNRFFAVLHIAAVACFGLVVTSHTAFAAATAPAPEPSSVPMGGDLASLQSNLDQQPCGRLLHQAVEGAEGGNNAQSHCKAADALKTAATADVSLAVVYGVLTGVCIACAICQNAAYCAATAFSGLQAACSYGAMGVGLIDGAVVQGVTSSLGQYAGEASKARGEFLTTVSSTGSTVMGLVGTISTGIGAGTAAVTTTTTTVVDGVATTTKTAADGTVTSATSSTTAANGTTTTQSGSNGDNAACILSAVAAGLQTVVKSANTQLLVDAANTNIRAARAVVAEQPTTLPPAALTPLTAPVASQIAANSSSITNTYGSFFNPNAGSGNVSSTGIPEMLNDAARTAGNPELASPQMANVMNGALASARASGINIPTPNDFANALSHGTMPDQALTSAIPMTGAMMTSIAKNSDAITRELGIKNAPRLNRGELYAKVGGGAGGKAGAKGPDFASMLAGMLNPQKGDGAGGGRAPTGVSALHFGSAARASKAGENEIHPPTHSLFDVVSSRWAAITVRFMQEDVRNGAAPATTDARPGLAVSAPVSSVTPAVRTPAAAH